MGVTHTVPAGLPTGTVTGQVAGDDWRADHFAPIFDVTLISAVNAAVTPAAASAAANTELYSTGKSTRRQIDLTHATDVRLLGLVIANGNVTTASFKLSYMTTFASTWAGTDSGATLVLGTGTAGALRAGAWTAIPAGMKADVAITVLVGVALGTTPPTIGSLSLQYR